MAYADFVTAMMALFIVLWIIKDRPEMAEQIAATFRKPLEGQKGGSTKAEVPVPGVDYEKLIAEQHDERLDRIAAEIQKVVESDEEEKSMDIQVTADALKVTLYDRNKRPFFEKDSAQLTKWGEFVLESLSWIIERKKMLVFIEGHTAKSKGAEKSATYGAWELSAERANVARKALIAGILEPKLVTRLSGYGDSQPLPGKDPAAEENSRITLNLNLLK